MSDEGNRRIAEALVAPAIRPDTPHYEAVGRFVTSYANAETAIHLLVRKLSGLSDEKARIIFSGMRLADIPSASGQFSELIKPKKKSQMK